MYDHLLDVVSGQFYKYKNHVKFYIIKQWILLTMKTIVFGDLID